MKAETETETVLCVVLGLIIAWLFALTIWLAGLSDITSGIQDNLSALVKATAKIAKWEVLK